MQERVVNECGVRWDGARWWWPSRRDTFPLALGDDAQIAQLPGDADASRDALAVNAPAHPSLAASALSCAAVWSETGNAPLQAEVFALSFPMLASSTLCP